MKSDTKVLFPKLEGEYWSVLSSWGPPVFSVSSYYTTTSCSILPVLKIRSRLIETLEFVQKLGGDGVKGVDNLTPIFTHSISDLTTYLVYYIGYILVDRITDRVSFVNYFTSITIGFTRNSVARPLLTTLHPSVICLEVQKHRSSYRRGITSERGNEETNEN